jgi:hypothetical protein
VPVEASARADWLYDLWQDVDDWLGEQFANAAEETTA